ncbi:MAG: PorV/PorQ family protein [Deltaproteobacteria bacterium]|nr:PorV/PorQ family protein [Deltaproteobacteria bacterium]
MTKIITAFTVTLFFTIVVNFSFAAFNDIGVGARPLGLGGAFVAVADDGNAPRYNAGGLGYIDDVHISLMYAQHFSGLIDYNYVGAVLPLSIVGSLGASFGQLEEDSDIYKERTITLSYSKKLANPLAAGINFKLLNIGFDGDNEWVKENSEYFTTTSASAFTMDIGVMAKPITGLSIGLSAQNLIPADVNIGEDLPDENRETVPTNFRVGMAYNLSSIAASAQQEALRDVLALTQGMIEASFRNGEREIHIGAEAWIQKVLGVRAGYAAKSGVHSSSSFAIGASIKIPVTESTLQFDYAFQVLVGELESKAAHRVSTNIIF